MSVRTNYPGIRQAIWLLVLTFLAIIGVSMIVVIFWGDCE